MNFTINKELLILKCLYFFQLSIIACLFIYLTPFMDERGITATEMALMNFVANMFAFFSRPLFGFIADKYQKYKELLIVLSLLCGVVYSVHLASPKRVKPVIYSLDDTYKLNVSANENLLIIYTSNLSVNDCWPTNLSQCHFTNQPSLNLSFSLDQIHRFYVNYVPMNVNLSLQSQPLSMVCEYISSICNDTRQPFHLSVNNVGLTWSATFWFLAILKTMGYIVFSPLVSLTDAVTFVTLGPNNAHKFGFTRMFGTIGVLVFSLIMAGLLQLVTHSNWSWVIQMQQISQFTPCFIVATVIFAVLILTIFFLRTDKPIKTGQFMKKQSLLYRLLNVTALNVMFRDWEIGIFFLFSVLGGFLLQVFAEYFFLIAFRRYSILPKYFPGLITVVMTISESAFFGFSSRLLKFKDYEIWISLSFIAWSIRWFSYIFIENFWLLLLTEVLHGPSFGLMLSCMMAHIGKLGTETTHGRIQGLFSGIYFNIGGALGGLIGGIILDNLGMFGLFKFMSALSLLCGLYYPIQRCLIARMCKDSVNDLEIVIMDDHDDKSNGKPLLLSDEHA